MTFTEPCHFAWVEFQLTTGFSRPYQIVSIIRKLERVGNHITNVAEEVIFYKEAKVLRHIKKRENDHKEN